MLILALVASVIVTAGLAAGLTVHRSTVWTSQTTMMLDDPYGLALSGDPGQISKLSYLRNKYAELASTYAIAQPVAQSLHVPVGEVLGSSYVNVPSVSILMNVVGTSASPVFAKEVSAAMARGISNYIDEENAKYHVPAADQFAAITVSPTSAPSPSKPSHTKAALLSLLVFVGTLLVVFVPGQLILVHLNRR